MASAGADAQPLALIAGDGYLPIEIARNLRACGERVVAVGFEGVTDRALAEEVDVYHSLALGQITAMASALHDSDVARVLLVGKIPKALLIEGGASFAPDAEAMDLLARHRDRSDDGLLALTANWLEEQGFELADQTRVLESMLAPEGVLTRRAPSDEERADLVAGLPVAEALGRSGVGQCLVVKAGAVLAVEAIEGTDATIRRAGEVGGAGATVLKFARPDQDRRFDLPAVGPETIHVMASAGARALALEPGSVLLVDRRRFVAEAEAADIAVWGFVAKGDR